jgi:hypothetical protein
MADPLVYCGFGVLRDNGGRSISPMGDPSICDSANCL